MCSFKHCLADHRLIFPERKAFDIYNTFNFVLKAVEYIIYLSKVVISIEKHMGFFQTSHNMVIFANVINSAK